LTEDLPSDLLKTQPSSLFSGARAARGRCRERLRLRAREAATEVAKTGPGVEVKVQMRPTDLVDDAVDVTPPA